MSRPLISVTMTCYNLGRYLAEAVDSVLAQTVQDFEILIDDDGSNDLKTRRILDGFERPRTTVFRSEHRGVPGVRNFLTDKARGRYLCGLDADDKLHPRYFEKALDAMDSATDVGIVSCWVQSFGEEEGIWRQDRADLPALLAECTLLGPSLVKRQAVMSVGAYDEALVQGNEDWDLFIRLVAAGYRAVIVPEVLFYYRRRQGSLTDICTKGQTHLDLQRYLFQKHRQAYLAHLPEVLAWKDRDAENLKRENLQVKRQVAQNILPQLERRRTELELIDRRRKEHHRLQALEADHRWARAHIEELHRSKSWRITAPLRWIQDLWLGSKMGEDNTAEDLDPGPARSAAQTGFKSWAPTPPISPATSDTATSDTATSEDPEETLLARDRQLLDLRQHQRDLYQWQWALEERLGIVRRQLDSAVEEGATRVDWGDLRRTSPLSPVWGLDRGLPLDRYYIEAFLDQNRADIRGHVLEIKDGGYTRMFGDDRVTRADVLDLDPDNDQATLVGDLTDPEALPKGAFDCFIFTQTLHLIYDLRAALHQALEALRPGGVLLCTVPSVSRISYEDDGIDGDFWRFTEASVRRLFADLLPDTAFEITGYGNVLACTAFLYGFSPHELTIEELDEVDPFFPLIYSIRATRIGGEEARGRPVLEASSGREPQAAILAYHRMDLAAFRQQMEHLVQHCKPAPLACLGDESWPDRTVAITFDDGYLEVSSVSEILVELGIPATFFIVGEALEEGHEYWWDVLTRVFGTGPFSTDHPFGSEQLSGVLDLILADVDLDLDLTTPKKGKVAERQLWEIFHHLPRRARDAGVSALLAWSGVSQDAGVGRQDVGSKTLGRRQLLELAERPGHEIGGHTENHLALPLHPPEVQREQIAVGKARLEAVLGRQIEALAYPFGEYDEHSIQLARDLGFRYAVTVEAGPVRPGTDRFRLPRFEPSANIDEFKHGLAALFD